MITVSFEYQHFKHCFINNRFRSSRQISILDKKDNNFTKDIMKLIEFWNINLNKEKDGYLLRQLQNELN